MDMTENPLSRIKPTIGQIMALQAEIAKRPQKHFPVLHHFADGAYARELHMDAGDTVVGKMHRTQHFLIVASGHISVTTSAGQEDIVGPRVVITEPGTKRAIYAHTDAVLITFHVTDETDLEKIEAHVIQPDPVLPGIEPLQIEGEGP